jgi:DNA-binding NarL/FixJ family response regulator
MNVEDTIRVLLVDDHALLRQGVRSILESSGHIQVVGEAVNGQEGIERAQELMPDVILMDINMPLCGGLEATRRIKSAMPYVKILMLTVSETEKDLFEAVKGGAQGYLLKNVDPDQLIDGVRKVARGEAVIPGALATKIIAEFDSHVAKEKEKPGVELLTQRELEVLGCLSTGASNKEIANRLFISEHTVRNHIQNILGKLHLGNRVQAAAYAVKEGIAPPKPTK